MHENIWGFGNAHKCAHNHRLPRYLEPWHVCGFQIEFLVMPEIFAFVCALLVVSAHFVRCCCVSLSRLNLFRESRSKDEIEASNKKKTPDTQSIERECQQVHSNRTKSYYILCFYKIFLKTLTKDTNFERSDHAAAVTAAAVAVQKLK